jgi:hypothetical protein
MDLTNLLLNLNMHEYEKHVVFLMDFANLLLSPYMHEYEKHFFSFFLNKKTRKTNIFLYMDRICNHDFLERIGREVSLNK